MIKGNSGVVSIQFEQNLYLPTHHFHFHAGETILTTIQSPLRTRLTHKLDRHDPHIIGSFLPSCISDIKAPILTALPRWVRAILKSSQYGCRLQMIEDWSEVMNTYTEYHVIFMAARLAINILLVKRLHFNALLKQTVLCFYPRIVEE